MSSILERRAITGTFSDAATQKEVILLERQGSPFSNLFAYLACQTINITSQHFLSPQLVILYPYSWISKPS